MSDISKHNLNSTNMITTVQMRNPATQQFQVSTTSHQSIPIGIIVLCLWPCAHEKQINYYVDGYRMLHPRARILLLPASQTRTDMNALLDEIHHAGEKCTDKQGPGVLLHIFGDNAADQACRLLRAHRARTAQTMKVKTAMFDCVPTLTASTLHAMRSSWMTIDLCACFSFLFLMMASTGILSSVYYSDARGPTRDDACQLHILPADVRKCYIFPATGTMFAWDRKGDPNEAINRIDAAVRRQLVDCGRRWNGDQERYWTTIGKLTDGY